MTWPATYTYTLRQLSVMSLYQEVDRLENSIKHLRRSNTELKQHELEAEEDTSWVEPTIAENEQAIAKQTRQIELVKLELSGRQAVSNATSPEPNRRLQGSNGGNGVSHSEAINGEGKTDVATSSENGLRL